MVRRLFAGLLAMGTRRTYVRYIAASIGALAADLALFMALLGSGIPAATASASGYIAGIAIHWLLSSRAVFATAESPAARHRQKLLFLASALLGLAITSAIVGSAGLLGIDPRLAKGIAIAVSFHATYLLRKTVVFA